MANSKNIISALVLLMLMSVSSVFANSNLIYNNGTPNLTDSYNSGTRLYADDFTLSNDYLWTDLHFWYDQPRSPTDVSLWDGDLTYILYADNAGKPGTIIESDSIEDLSSSYTGRTPSFGGVTYYEYLVSFYLNDPILLDGGTKYWLGLQFFDPYPGPATVRWSGTDGSPDSLFYYYNYTSPGGWTAQSVGTGKNYGLAFQLTGLEPAPVPEPSTFILLGAGLAGLVAWRRKRS